MTLSIAQLDEMPSAEAAFKLAACCGSSSWVAGMLALRPFGSRSALLARATTVADTLERDDWLEAFSHHPRIGERDPNAVVSETAESWSTAEQSAIASANAVVRSALVDANAAYEQRFGFIFIIRAAGRGATEILSALRERMANTPEAELLVASKEQRQITRLRLEKLVLDEDA